ncbi:hypothetical protein NO559_07085 [Dasania sp. GY-MA-18]|uniref:Uncharacterized protein n=1 Tax=Dasania phycosphaerae TaxID=2950436 RepID=A0A9J6RL98_9GAMM|nr:MULTISPECIES: hypothetical protein [Dasania]MCR8922531.1 hypothetical protein [Dasania sp. GY-MA-18]MCZ0864959.1 hypothetical protein [Dasania phycosphaerae]MCZ0868687.1 hypothetical protein [Dasania phycosphaerae]
MAVRPSPFNTCFCLLVLATTSAKADHMVCEPQAAGSGQTTPLEQVAVKHITINNRPIFEEDDKAIWLHYLANNLHIKTQPHIIENHLSFEKGDTISLDDVEESERLLRQLDYLRDANVRFEKDCNHQPNGNINVTTWDHWTLYPKINFSRSGGENKYSYGLKDDNLLGLGIQGNFRYFADKDRTGYGIKVDAPITYIKHSELSLAAFDNDDGYRYGIAWRKPFYTLNTTDSYYFDNDHSKQDLHIDQNGDDENVFIAKRKFFETGYGWSQGKVDGWTRRWTLGLTASDESFAPIMDSNDVSLAVPNDRHYIYPWLQYQVIEDDFEVISDVHFIHEKEDHHLGWRRFIRLGFEADNDDSDKDYAGHLRASISKGMLVGKHLWFGSASGTVDFGVAEDDYYKASAGFEYFYNWTPANKLYVKTEITLSGNNYIDQPITLGGNREDDDNSFGFSPAAQPTVRGYPSQYQHGNNRWQTTVEARHYPSIELYRLVRVAWVGFIDAGRASGTENIVSNNEQSGTLASIGFGLRLASIRSSGQNVIHIDIAKPLTTGDNVDSWSISAHAEKKF